MRIGSLFSGIGGLELGVLAALAEAGIPARVVWQVEIDAFCRSVLAQHFPDADRSVIDVRAAGSLRPVDLIVGGFPCQDVSSAGKGEGLSGERSGLWWAYRDVVRALRPGAVLVENVASGLPRWHGPVRCSLEALGYRTWARQIGAHDVGAPHRRERVFVLAHAHGQRGVEPEGGKPHERRRVAHGGSVADPRRERRRLEQRGDGGALGAGASCAGQRGEGLADATCERWHEGERRKREERRRTVSHLDGPLGDTGSEGRSRSCGIGVRGARSEDAAPKPGGRVGEAQPGLGGGLDGLPAGMDIPSWWPASRGEEQQAWEPPRTVTGKEPLRRARLRALGNAVVPAQAREAMRWALDVMRNAELL